MTIKSKMLLADVRPDTAIELYTHKRYDAGSAARPGPENSPTTVSVHALKECGCDGPWLGDVVAVPYKEWSLEMRKARREAKVTAKVWYIYPTITNGYSRRKQPVGWALGKKQAANKLRDWIAQRNIAEHNKRIISLVQS